MKFISDDDTEAAPYTDLYYCTDDTEAAGYTNPYYCTQYKPADISDLPGQMKMFPKCSSKRGWAGRDAIIQTLFFDSMVLFLFFKFKNYLIRQINAS